MASSLTVVVLLAALVPACGGSSTRPPLTAERPPVPASPPRKTQAQATDETPREEPLPFVAQSSDATEDGAYDSAKRRLLVALLNDESLLRRGPFSDRLARVVHDRETDPYEQAPTGDGIGVKIGLRPEQLDVALSRLSQGLTAIDLVGVPAQLRDRVRELREARLQAKICARRKELIPQSECEAPSTTAAENELERVLGLIVLEPAYEGGIPASETTFLRPLRISALLRETGIDEPLAGLPLQLQVGDTGEPISVRTNDQGQLIYALPEELAPATQFTLDLDIPSLVGGKLGAVDVSSLSVQGRPTGMARCALVLMDDEGADRVVGSVAERELESLTHRRVDLTRKDAQRLRRLPRERWKKELPRLADEYRGRLDTLLVLETESEFASRMGTHRVWFEARGKLTAVDVWSGQVITEVSAVVTESGVGETRAERASREALGRELAEKLRAALQSAE